MEQVNIFDFDTEDKHYEYEKVFKKGQTIKLFEAFAGIGCQAMAFKRAGIPYETVGISEIDKYAIQSYNLIHGDVKNYGDISKMVEIPKCDVFTWSFPCTDLSKAGKREGLQGGTRSGLVYEVLRLLSATKEKPKVLIMENVPDLVQKKFKDEFYEIQKEIESYGYKNFTQRLNAKHYGVAQNRDRVFMVSILGDYHYEFPPREKLKLRLKDYLEDNVDEKYYLNAKFLNGMLNGNSGRVKRKEQFMRSIKPTENKNIAFTITTRVVDDNGLAPAVKENHGTVTAVEVENAKGLYLYDSEKFSKEPLNEMARCLKANKHDSAVIENNLRIRKLTPRECWRLMGISDSDFDKVNGKISNSQLYKQAGNGIVVDVFAKILKGLVE